MSEKTQEVSQSPCRSEPSLEDEPVAQLHAKTFLTVFAVCFIYFAQLVNVVGAGAQAQTIVAVVGGSASSVWLTSTIAILTAVLSPIVSQAADYWGRRWFLLALTACGVIGSIVVARANTVGMAIAGFTVSGLSYGAQPLLHAVASEVLPRRHRPWAQGLANLLAALGGVVALLVGGSMTRHSHSAGFRNFYLSQREKLARLDWVGYGLLAASLVLFCMGLAWSQNPYAWSDAHTSATFAIGVALVVALIAYETWGTAEGMLHHGLFGHRNFVLALMCVFVEGLVFFAANNYFAYEASVLYETDTLRTGLRYTVNMPVYGASALVAGWFCSTTKRVRWPAVSAFTSMVVGPLDQGRTAGLLRQGLGPFARARPLFIQ